MNPPARSGPRSRRRPAVWIYLVGAARSGGPRGARLPVPARRDAGRARRPRPPRKLRGLAVWRSASRTPGAREDRTRRCSTVRRRVRTRPAGRTRAAGVLVHPGGRRGNGGAPRRPRSSAPHPAPARPAPRRRGTRVASSSRWAAATSARTSPASASRREFDFRRPPAGGGRRVRDEIARRVGDLQQSLPVS